MTSAERLQILRKNPVFWSRLGFGYDPPLKNKEGKPLVFNENLDFYAKSHRSFSRAGVKIQSSVLHLGWMGVDEFDYSLCDRVLDSVFYNNPDIYYIPRIKLNVPVDWCYENPEDVFVYYGGPQTAEEIKRLVGTEKHDYLGYEAPMGYYAAGEFSDSRPNVGGMIARQSFSSKKWLHDAGEALGKLIERIENGKYGERILGYHIAYGVSGETITWGRMSNRFGDYGINNTKAFFEWAEKKYGSLDAVAKAYGQDAGNLHIPSPEVRDGVADSVFSLMRSDKNDVACIDYDIFTSEMNAKATEHFAKIVKTHAKEKLVGVFYGYFIEVNNSAYAGHLAIDRLLDSPYVDFFAGPKSYYRCTGKEPGCEMCPTQSVNLRKLWMDEADIRTYLAKSVPAALASDSLSDTVKILRREFSKNTAHGSGFWWMDLGGGWFDGDEIMNEISSLVKLNEKISDLPHESISDVLVVVDEKCINHMRTNELLRCGFMQDFICEVNSTGAVADVYRLSDIETLNLSQYKLVIFAYCFEVDDVMRKIIREKLPKDSTVMFNYAAGIINGDVSFENIRDFTGFSLAESKEKMLNVKGPEVVEGVNGFEDGDDGSLTLPALCVCGDAKSIKRNELGENVFASACVGGRRHIINLIPYLKSAELREIAKEAGCKMHTEDAGVAVYADSRIRGIFPCDERDGRLEEI